MIGKRFFIAVCLVFFCAPTAPAQLRPLDPVDFRAFGGAATRAQIGAGVFFDQHASLAGTRGTLWELANVRATFRTGRVVIELGGTVQRLFEDHSVVDAPFGDARQAPADGERHDAGDYRVASAVRLSSDNSATLAVLRFGTRLPTTDNRVGLDRDATDFFATLAAQRRFAPLSLALEAGLSINGTREPTHEQSDVLVYALSGEIDFGRLTPFVVALGQQDFHDSAIRGNEDLSELRLGARAGQQRWIDVAWVRGLSEFSPSNGLQLNFGMTFGSR
ncbi:MAG: hypothetical protein ACT4O1_06375 [Gemmatimonadota bacterium]